MTAPTVVLMLKAPVEGEVKTRLGREIGSAAATRAYRRLVEHQIKQIPNASLTHISYAPAEAGALMREWLGEAHGYSPQTNGDLGERLIGAMERHFECSAAPLMFIGGDCPYLLPEIFESAARGLRENDAVIVPALDGGYCLISFRRAIPQVFRSIAWSTDSVLDETRARLRELGLSWLELAPAEDVDDTASWRRAVTIFPHLESAE